MDRIAATNAFVRVVEAGTFTRAADTMGLPASTATRRVQGLEQGLKVRLLHRTTRSLTVTPEGAKYHQRVVRLLADPAVLLGPGLSHRRSDHPGDRAQGATPGEQGIRTIALTHPTQGLPGVVALHGVLAIAEAGRALP